MAIFFTAGDFIAARVSRMRPPFRAYSDQCCINGMSRLCFGINKNDGHSIGNMRDM